MAHKIGNRLQQTYLPSTIDDYVGPQDLVRVYDAFVDALDFKSLGIRTQPTGSADSYYPPVLLKLIIYGYSYGIRSSRKLERACYHNLSFQWLLGGQKPDYRTIARFRSDNKEPIKKVLRQCVRICMDLDLIEGNIFFTDGSKFRANASINKTWTKERCAKHLKKIDEQIDQLIETCEAIDKDEAAEGSMVELKQKIEEKEQLVKKMQETLAKVEKDPKGYINTTDPESVKAKGRQGTHACHNVQMTTDSKHGLIVQAESVGHSNDLNQLKEQVDQAIANTGLKPQHVCADSGYCSPRDLSEIDPSIQVVVPNTKQAQEEKGAASSGPFDKERFVYNKDTDEYICPEGNRLRRISAHPSGSNKEYLSYQARDCGTCRHFGICTNSPTGRQISRSIYEEFRETLAKAYDSPQGQQIYSKRKEKSELPYGHIKSNLSAGQFMLRGKAKTDAEISILSTCFNVARMITILGVPGLIARLNGA